MENSDLYKFRVEELDRSRESLRTVEWRTFFEMVAAYLALVVAFAKINPQTGRSWALCVVGLAATAIVSFAGYIVLHGVHVRMQWMKDTRNIYIEKLHDSAGIHGEEAPKFWEYWAIFPQYLILVTSAGGVISWMLWKTVSIAGTCAVQTH